MITRRTLFAAAAPAALALSARAQSALRELRIGYQKNGILVVAKQQKAIENRLKPLGIEVKWIEFSFGPPLLEALNIGSIDFGTTGDAPPIFAQAAGANLLYVAAQPAAGAGSAILLPKGSTVHSLADLKGKRIAFAKASSAHNFTVAALEKAGLAYKDVQPLHLAPADAAAAFARGSVDAWTIWDPYFAIAEKGEGVRILTLAKDIAAQNSFFLANRAFTERHGSVVRAVIDELATVASWSQANKGEVTKLLSEGTGVELDATRRAVERTDFVIEPVSAAVAAEQQRVADRFHALGLIPKRLDVRTAVWTPPAS
jgi:NitT/TauT family transport system substrate-binding protein/sulfonate transport system substrate-binding protein